MTNPKAPAPPQISPYVFPVLLAGLGLWCLYDGWFTTDPEMLKHQLFNRIASGVLLVWAVIDFIRTRKRDKAEQAERTARTPESTEHD
ncbi:MAG: hypothetical protein LBD10_08600 [Desulfobulbus sp.]|jgi:hypothetical protein|uniref:hypothetical protein n=1 Tax=Desulfobulbus sp. TaxID=895 RepID=UPI00284D126A|nr:hypothetical protein [Desulfobulbus sp.]MDR2550239.1 hypothetical protein [Desulfobulbus sp.]